jgi:2'-5' RNA ligase
MPRLFVAIELPATAATELVRIQPQPRDGIRLVERQHMHVTLHFIGEADIEDVAATLASLPAAVSVLTLEGVGQFSGAGGEVILWAAVEQSSALMDLHAAVGGALAGLGFCLETRPYRPHVTLARCEPGVGPAVANDFLARNGAFLLSNVPVVGFTLCSSESVGDKRLYRVERSFQPRTPAGGPASRIARDL